MEASTVGEHRTFPSVETVEAACLTEYFGTWTKIEVISVAEYYFSVDFVDEFVLMDSLNGGGGADRHEYRSRNISVIGVQNARTGVGRGVSMNEFVHKSKL